MTSLRSKEGDEGLSDVMEVITPEFPWLVHDHAFVTTGFNNQSNCSQLNILNLWMNEEMNEGKNKWIKCLLYNIINI